MKQWDCLRFQCRNENRKINDLVYEQMDQSFGFLLESNQPTFVVVPAVFTSATSQQPSLSPLPARRGYKARTWWTLNA